MGTTIFKYKKLIPLIYKSFVVVKKILNLFIDVKQLFGVSPWFDHRFRTEVSFLKTLSTITKIFLFAILLMVDQGKPHLFISK
jgi:hypothetical protein